MRLGVRRAVAVSVRLVAFAVTIVPLAALFLPWITLDGSEKSHTGVACIALLASPIREYLYEVDPVHAVIVTLSPVLVVLLSIVTGSRYYKRRAVFWAPPALLLVALAVTYLTSNLVSNVHEGPWIAASAAIALTLHQAAIRLQVTTRRSRKLSWASGPLAVATGIDEQPRGRR